jgi:NADPH:quinone reductase-like Zn-dependent oxidoreductase
MKAAVITEYGELDKVKVAEMAEPGPGAGEVLIQVKSAALNHLDIWVRKGRPGVDEKLSRAEQIGAKHTINYKRRDVAVCVKELT